MGYSTTQYSGATSYTVAGKVITLSGLSAADDSAGGFTINVAAAPEPSTWALLLSGLAGFCFLGGYRRKLA